MGVKTANRLADRFKTTQNGRPVASGAEILQLGTQARDSEKSRVLAAANNLFGPKPSPTEPAPVEPTPAPEAAAPTDPIAARLDKVISALDNQSASFDLLIETMAGVHSALTGIQTAMTTVQEREKQAISATANLTAMISRTQDGTAAGLMQVGQIVRDGQNAMLEGIMQVVQAVRETQAPTKLIETTAEVLADDVQIPLTEVDPSVYAEFDPTVEVAKSVETVETERFVASSEIVDEIRLAETPLDVAADRTIDVSDIMHNPVYSKLEGGVRPYTIIKIERGAFDRTGLSPDSRVEVEYLSDERRLNVRAVERGGVKIKQANRNSVIIQARTLGVLNMDKALCETGSQEFSLRAM